MGCDIEIYMYNKYNHYLVIRNLIESAVRIRSRENPLKHTATKSQMPPCYCLLLYVYLGLSYPCHGLSWFLTMLFPAVSPRVALSNADGVNLDRAVVDEPSI